MSSIVIAGDTSGTCTLQANAAAGSTVLTLPTTSGVLYSTPTGGVIPAASGGTGLSSVGTAGNVLTSDGTGWVSQAGVSSGAIMMWPTGTAPSGWLLANGAAVSRTTYAALFAVISTTFGVGDGSTTFNVPNYTNRFPYGTTVGSTGGTADSVVVSHTHTATSSVTDPGHSHSVPNNSGGSLNGMGNVGGRNYGLIDTEVDVTGISVATTVNSTGVSGTNANLPPFLGINFIIKT